MKAYGDNGGTAAAFVLDPMEMTASLAVTTTASSNPITFTAGLTSLDNWNVTTSSSTKQTVTFTGANGRIIALDVLPAQLARTSGIGTSFLSALTNLGIKRVDMSTGTLLNSLPSAVSDLRSITKASPSGSLKNMYNGIAQNAIAAAGTTIADFTTKVGTTKWGLVSLTPADLGSASWSSAGSTVTVNAQVGTASAKNFTCSLAGLSTITSSANSVLKFQATDEDAFWVKCFDSTGLDATADTSIAASQQPALLAMQLVNTLGAQATIAHADLSAIVTAGLS